MILESRYLPEKVCSTSPDRVGLAVPWIVGNELIATDGCMMAILPISLSDSGDGASQDGYIPVEAIKAARKLTTKRNNLSVIHCQPTECTTQDDQKFGRLQLKTPNYTMVLPPKNPDILLRIGIDADRLLKLGLALGKKKENGSVPVELVFSTCLEDAITLSGLPGELAILMPFRQGKTVGYSPVLEKLKLMEQAADALMEDPKNPETIALYKQAKEFKLKA